MEFLGGETLADRPDAARSRSKSLWLSPQSSQAKLLDFGLAKLRGTSDATPVLVSAAGTEAPNLAAVGTVLGTLQYMSPEQLEGKEADGLERTSPELAAVQGSRAAVASMTDAARTAVALSDQRERPRPRRPEEVLAGSARPRVRLWPLAA